jgi:hypothetical protein
MFKFKIYQSSASPMIAIALVLTMIFASPVVAVDAEPKKPSYECNYIPDSGTIGKVECCDMSSDPKDENGVYCTTCDNTQPPSNCTPREPVVYRVDPKIFDEDNVIQEGGIFSQDTPGNSSVSEGVDKNTIQEGGTFSENTGLSDSNANIDTNNIPQGGSFSQ